MKEMKCLDCDERFKANSPEEMMKTMMPHYMKKHKEIMSGSAKESKEDWMKRFYSEWEKAEET